MRLKLIASLLALCLIFSIGSALANTGTKDYEKTSGAMTDKMSGMAGMSCGKISEAMTDKMSGMAGMSCGKTSGAMTDKMKGTADMSCGKTSGAMTDKMKGTMAGHETESKDC